MRRFICSSEHTVWPGSTSPGRRTNHLFRLQADNDDAASVFGLDDTAQKVCDRSVEATWFSPTTFEPAKVIWNDGLSTKAIYRTGDKRYEHDFLLLVHIGHCDKVEPTAAQKCSPP